MTREGHVFATTASLPHLLRSTDSGKTWTSRQLVLDPPHRDGGVQSFAVLSDDTFLVAYQVDERVWVSRSDDLGESWQPSVYIDPSPYEYAGGGTHGFMLELPDGKVLLPLGHYWKDQEEIAGALFIYRSSDKGRSWGDRSRVTFWGWEADLLRRGTDADPVRHGDPGRFRCRDGLALRLLQFRLPAALAVRIQARTKTIRGGI